jgi:hypothetical protein
MLETLRSDFQRIPGLLAQGPPDQPVAADQIEEEEIDSALAAVSELRGADQAEPAPQLGLF